MLGARGMRARRTQAMNIDDSRWITLAAIAVIILLAVGAWLLYRQRESRRLQQRFGTEYERTVDVLGSQSKAESELLAREKRVQGLTLVPLPAAEAARFSQSWSALQGRFVDSPSDVVVEAERLVRDLMLRRGYPMGDFERLAADISVDHPDVVHHYRAAQGIATRCQRGDADTEQMREAVVHYRALFDELLEVAPNPPVTQVAPAGSMAART
jgi:ABC-type nickel/cobalt efflux system permease component RcnA